MRSRMLAIFALLIALTCAEETEEGKVEVKKTEPKRPSTLAPTVAYLDLWTFIHGKDSSLPKVLYLPGEEDETDDKEPPSWLTSAAMSFKEGRTYKAKFAVIKATDAARVATRFGIEPEKLPMLLGCRTANGGSARILPKSELLAGGGAAVRAVKGFVTALVDSSDDSTEGAMPLPAFPEPTRPRKSASASLEEFTHESITASCYSNPSRPLCVVALVNEPAGHGCPDTMSELARKFRNDKTVAFGCVGAARQHDFLRGFGLSAAELPALMAVKGGRRPRAARMQPSSGGALDDPTQMASFVDSLLGGGASFSKLTDGLPELEAPALLDTDDAAPEKDEM